MIQVPESSPVRESLPPPSASFNNRILPVDPIQMSPATVAAPDRETVVIGDSPVHHPLTRPSASIDLISPESTAKTVRAMGMIPTLISGTNQADMTAENIDGSVSQSQASFAAMASNFRHDPSIQPGGSRPRPQTGPMRAMPVGFSRSTATAIDDLSVDVDQNKLRRMLMVFPNVTTNTLRQALAMAGGNYDVAVDSLAGRLDKLGSESFTGPARTAAAAAPTATRRFQVGHKSIQEKWASRADADTEPSVEAPRKRLVRGRRQGTVPDDSASDAKPKEDKSSDDESSNNGDDSDDSDAVPTQTKRASRPMRVATGESIDRTVTRFLNSATAKQLSELVNQPDDAIAAVIEGRPYSHLHEVRLITIRAVTKGLRSRAVVRKVGDKMVDACVEMFEGYAAVDALVGSCQSIGRPLTDAVEAWGFKLGDGELEIVGDENDDGSGGKTENSAAGGETAVDADEDDEVVIRSRAVPAAAKQKPKTASRSGWLEKPAMMADDFELKDYQVVGLNWLSLLHKHRLSGILADDMGLGKTCQVISFFSHLAQTGSRGPHLVVVPGSTLENWLREFKKFSPTLRVEPYYGSLAERAEQRENITRRRDRTNVIVTTYDVAWRPNDCHFLRKIEPVVAVFDEGHSLKNQQSKRHAGLMKIPAESRILLTGTPLQNNLQELVSLLAFIMPRLFNRHQESLSAIFKYKAKTTDANHDGLLADARTSRAKSILAPFILRRKKHQVLKHLPKKTLHVMLCDMDDSQKELYEEILDRQKEIVLARQRGEGGLQASAHVLMDFRKAAIHPLLFRRLYDDELLDEMSVAAIREVQFRNSNIDYVREDMSVYTDFNLHRLCEEHPRNLGHYMLDSGWLFRSGKVAALQQLLTRFAASGDRTLIFSQFTTVMDILEHVLAHLSIPFCRLDGSTPVSERQDLIDTFTSDPSIRVFMLSTKAGGTGINLIAATKVIIFDLSFNPQEDVQAENRAHRVGQTRDVDIYRLVSRGTIEEKIHALGVSKIALDECVAGEMDAAAAVAKAEEAEMEAVSLVEHMLAEELKKMPPRPKRERRKSIEGRPKKLGVDLKSETGAGDVASDGKVEEAGSTAGVAAGGTPLPTPADSDDGKKAKPRRGRLRLTKPAHSPVSESVSVKTAGGAKPRRRAQVVVLDQSDDHEDGALSSALSDLSDSGSVMVEKKKTKKGTRTPKKPTTAVSAAGSTTGSAPSPARRISITMGKSKKKPASAPPSTTGRKIVVKAVGTKKRAQPESASQGENGEDEVKKRKTVAGKVAVTAGKRKSAETSNNRTIKEMFSKAK